MDPRDEWTDRRLDDRVKHEDERYDGLRDWIDKVERNAAQSMRDHLDEERLVHSAVYRTIDDKVAGVKDELGERIRTVNTTIQDRASGRTEWKARFTAGLFVLAAAVIGALATILAAHPHL